MFSRKKGSAAAVLAAPAAVGATAGNNTTKTASIHAASATGDDGAAVGTGLKRQIDDSDCEKRVVKAKKTPRHRKPRIWFMGHKFVVSEGHEDAAKAAFKNARNAKHVWTAETR